MKQIPYNNSSVTLKIACPAEWAIEDLTAVTIKATDDNAVELLADTAATLYTATTIDGAISQYDDSFILAAGSDSPAVGDTMKLAGTGSEEYIVVKGYDAATLTVTCEDIIDNDYDDGTDVYGLDISYDMDTSVVATFTAGLVFTITWTPTGTGIQIKDLYQIGKFATDVEGIRKRFGRLYPRAYSAFTSPVERIADMVKEAEIFVSIELEAGNMDYNRIINHDVLSQLLMAKMAYLWTLGADEDLADEREALSLTYSSLFGLASALPLWSDTDQDEKVDDDEVTTHEHIFENGW